MRNVISLDEHSLFLSPILVSNKLCICIYREPMTLCSDSSVDHLKGRNMILLKGVVPLGKSLYVVSSSKCCSVG